MITKLCNASELPPLGGMKAFRGNGHEICVAQTDDGLHAVDNHCPHQSAPLSEGQLECGQIVCPYHGWRFNIATGEPEIAGDPHLICYEIRQYDNEVFILLPD